MEMVYRTGWHVNVSRQLRETVVGPEKFGCWITQGRAHVPGQGNRRHLRAPIPYEVDWDGFGDEPEGLNFIDNISCHRLNMALRMICQYDMGKEAVRDGLTKIKLKTAKAAQGMSMTFEGGVLEMHRLYTLRTDGMFNDRWPGRPVRSLDCLRICPGRGHSHYIVSYLLTAFRVMVSVCFLGVLGAGALRSVRLAQAQALYASGSSDSLAEAEQIFPGCALYPRARGLLLSQEMGRPDEAGALFRRALSLNPRDAGLRIELGLQD